MLEKITLAAILTFSLSLFGGNSEPANQVKTLQEDWQEASTHIVEILLAKK